MISPPASKRLIQLFERELRGHSSGDAPASPSKRPPRVSGELDRQVVEYAAQVRTSGSTPEQMLVELKKMLSHAAPEVPSSDRMALMSSLTGRAIDAFFAHSREAKSR